MSRLDEDWQQRWYQLCDKHDEKGYESLSSDERIWYNVRGLIDAIENGGLISFYNNHGADDLDDTMEDLQKIDAIDVINMLEEVNQLFPNGKPPKDIDKRNEVIDSWEDGQYEDLLESLDDRFYDELQENLELKLDKVVRRLLS
ncbi:DUF4375 domain-containing protein [Bacillus sp. ISL-75]|uniref:DMP19 family protein n=1 Tax=Bacillus sp. ISL-75 TaxID=2819137 RepID=UPI001BEA28BD|nr:DUF4375 domain-containing protein [Bacillus sp. ISL-75]MBT2729208.1 DUF4375 domain-containing protein [Bacillus sp. ISL-75]